MADYARTWNTLEGSTSSVRIAGEISDSFVTLDGLKQGDGLSNLLFDIALEGAIRRAGVQRSGTIISKSHMLLGFADYIDIIGINRRAVEEAFGSCEISACHKLCQNEIHGGWQSTW